MSDDPATAPSPRFSAARMQQVQLGADLVRAAASVAAVFLAWFAVYEYVQDREAARRQVAIESIARVKAGDVIEALVRLDLSSDRYDGIDLDLARVMAWYEHVGTLYLIEGLVDRCIVKSAVAPYAPMLQEVLAREKYLPERKVNFDVLINRMATTPC